MNRAIKHLYWMAFKQRSLKNKIWYEEDPQYPWADCFVFIEEYMVKVWKI